MICGKCNKTINEDDTSVVITKAFNPNMNWCPYCGTPFGEKNNTPKKILLNDITNNQERLIIENNNVSPFKKDILQPIGKENQFAKKSIKYYYKKCQSCNRLNSSKKSICSYCGQKIITPKIYISAKESKNGMVMDEKKINNEVSKFNNSNENIKDVLGIVVAIILILASFLIIAIFLGTAHAILPAPVFLGIGVLVFICLIFNSLYKDWQNSAPDREHKKIRKLKEIKEAEEERIIKSQELQAQRQRQQAQRQRQKEREHYERDELIKEIRKMPRYERWKQEVINKCGRKCQICGITKNLEIHHSNYSIYSIVRRNVVTDIYNASECLELWDVNNGEALCHECHQKTESSKTRNKLNNYSVIFNK